MTGKPQLDARYHTPEPPLRLERVIRIQQRLFADMSGALTGLAAYLGDNLGLFRALGEAGPVAAADLAKRQGLCLEMTAEWLKVMTCAGYVEYQPDDELFSLPPEHAVVLASDGGPMSFAGGLQQIGGFADRLPALLDAFRNGGGVAQNSYSQDLREGMERLSATWFENELVESWIPALRDVRDRLRSGACVADVGCGSGRALVELARAFPASRFIGYDALGANVERAKRLAAAADVGERVSFEVRDVMKGIPAEFDLVTAFDSLHDLPDPVDGLAAIARGLKKDSTLIVLELGLGDNLADEVGPVGVIHHGTKLLYNLPVALAAYGKAPTNAGFTESYMRMLCRRTGLMFDRSIPARNPLHRLYALRTPPY